MVDRIWLKHYPSGIPAEIDPDRFSSIPDLLGKTVARFPNRPAFHNLGYTLTFTALERLSRDFAAFLQGLPGMGKGERVAIMSPNLLQYPVALFGILRAGMTVVNVNPLYTPRELEHQLKDSGAKAIVIVENFARTLQRVLPDTPVEHVITTQVGDLLPPRKRLIVNFIVKRAKRMVPAWRIEGSLKLRTALARGARSPFKAVDVAPDDIAFLQYTGGTTGVAKGAMLTHRNMVANVEQTGVWISGSFVEGAEIVIAPLPLYHIFCLTSTLSFMTWGSLVVLITNPRELRAFVKELGKWKWTVDDRRQYAVQRLAEYARLRPTRLLRSESGGRRRCGDTEAGGRSVEAGDGSLHHRSIWPDRNRTGRLRQSAGCALERHDRPAVSFHRRFDT